MGVLLSVSFCRGVAPRSLYVIDCGILALLPVSVALVPGKLLDLFFHSRTRSPRLVALCRSAALICAAGAVWAIILRPAALICAAGAVWAIILRLKQGGH